MVVFLSIIILGAIIALIARVAEQNRDEGLAETHERDRDESVIWPTDEEQAKKVAERNTGIMMQTMRDLGCQPEKDENDPYTFRATYQGETFTFFCASPYIRIYDLGWSHVDVKDPEYPTINEAMNAVNFNAGPKVVMTDKDENGIRYFHSHLSFLLHPEFSENTEFMKGQLDSFFSVKEDMRSTFHKLLLEQHEAMKKRRPIGFAIENAPETKDKTA